MRRKNQKKPKVNFSRRRPAGFQLLHFGDRLELFCRAIRDLIRLRALSLANIRRVWRLSQGKEI